MLKSDNTLCFSSGSEPFRTRRAGEDIVETPDAGEVIWADSDGVTCRRWNWRQCQRTAITRDTVCAYFVFDVLPPFDLKIAISAADSLRRELLAFSPDLDFEVETLNTPQP
jgi:DNA/RNA-binding domain of Phe-tRNA-synthetase-like protein